MKSVGEYLAPETSVNSVNSVGELLSGRRGYGKMPYPPKCVLGENTHPKLLWVPCIPWENTHPLGEKHKEGMAECHALL